MSYIKKLWFEEGLYPTEDTDFGEIFIENDFDFSDLDEDPMVEGDDDGRFNFGTIDTAVAHGDYDMNSDSASVDYDFYDVDTDPPVTEEDTGEFNFDDDESAEPEAEGDWDFNNNIPVDPDPENNIDFFDIDEDPPVIGPDDGEFDFGTTSPADNFESPDYDLKDIDEDPSDPGPDDGKMDFKDIDTDEEDFAEIDWDLEQDICPRDMNEVDDDDSQRITDWDFGEEEENAGWDFYDIEEYPDLKHTQFDIEWNFGEEELVGWILTRDTLKKYIFDCVDELTRGSFIAIPNDSREAVMPYINYQYFYNERTNKSFIQYNLYNDRPDIDREKLISMITWRIKNQFEYDTGIYPEIMNTAIQEVVPDNRYTVTPYTIGYWKSVDGYYEALEDRAEVELDMRLNNCPPNKKHNLWDVYQITEEIARRYNLLEDVYPFGNKKRYIEQAMALLTQYHDETYKDIYEAKMAELDATYNRERYINENLPDAVNEYMTWYREYFNANIPDIHTYTRGGKLKMNKIA